MGISLFFNSLNRLKTDFCSQDVSDVLRELPNDKSTVIGGVSGALSFGVGQLASQMFTGICARTSTLTANQVSWIVAGPQAVMHGLSQGWVAGISGGDIGQAFFSAMISSGVSSTVQMGGNSFMGNGDAATLLFGTVSGGLSAELSGGNFWQGAATGLVVSELNHVANKMAQPNNRPSKSNRRLERLERQGKVRSLTENEMALAKSIFGDNIDYQSVKIVRAKYYFLQSRNYAVTPNGNIYYPKSEADWTNVNGNEYIKHRFKEFLIHELTHVWQYQSGINVLWSALPLQILKFGTLGLVNPYTIPQNNMNFQSLNVEQQGSYMEGVFNGIYTNPF